MRVLVTWGSRLGGTEGIARTIAEQLAAQGVEVAAMPAAGLRSVQGYDAAVIGGALYASRWHKTALRLVERNIAALRRMPVWLFSSGPLDNSADRAEIPPVRDVAQAMERIGAVGHATFGGRLPPDAKGFTASAMARNRAGDWRNPARARAWAEEIAEALPTAHPRAAHEPAGHALWRLIAFAGIGWALCALVMGGLLAIAPLWLALTLHAIAAPAIFAALSFVYFRARGARPPVLVALVVTAMVIALDAIVVAGLIQHSADMFRSIAGTWLPFVLIFLATWATGSILAMMPEKRR